MFKYRILACALTLASAFHALAQKDTTYITTRQETGLMAPQVFLSDYDRAFGTTVPARWMFKTDVANTLRAFLSALDINIGAEYKLNPAFSVGLDYRFTTGTPLNTSWTLSGTQSHQIVGNLRWYYNMKRRIAAGKSASNFSGNYIALESSWFQPTSQEYSTASTGVGIKFGLQRRLLRYGYFDISYGVGVQQNKPGIYNRYRYFFSTQPKIALGFAAFKGNKSQEGSLGAACDVLKCFREERRMFKIDLYNLLSVTSAPGSYKGITLNPRFDYEQKLGSLPLSVELGYAVAASRINVKYPSFLGKFNRISNTGAAELHWYFLQRRNILQGKSGNNLSGFFAGVRTAYEFGYQWGTDRQIPTSLRYSNNTPSVYGIAGMQHHIFERGFVQFKLGFGQLGGVRNTARNDGNTYISTQNPAWNLFSEFKAGLAF